MTGKKILLVSILVAVCCISLLLNYTLFKAKKLSDQRIELLSQNTSNGQASIITKYVHDSIEHVVIKEVPVTTVVEKNIAVGSGYMDTLTRAIKIAANRIDEVTKINAKLVAENVSLRKSNADGSYKYQDKWLNVTYMPDSNKIDLSYDVGLQAAKYWKRSWLLAPKQYYVDVFADDPRVQINAVKRYTLSEEKQRRLGIGFNAGYSFIPFLNKWQASVGVGLNYNLIEF